MNCPGMKRPGMKYPGMKCSVTCHLYLKVKFCRRGRTRSTVLVSTTGTYTCLVTLLSETSEESEGVQIAYTGI